MAKLASRDGGVQPNYALDRSLPAEGFTESRKLCKSATPDPLWAETGAQK